MNAVDDIDIYEVQTPRDPSNDSSFGVLSENGDLAKIAAQSQRQSSQGMSTEESVRSAAMSQSGEAEFNYYPNKGASSIDGNSSNPEQMNVIGIYTTIPSSNNSETSNMVDNLMYHLTDSAKFTDKQPGLKHSVDDKGNYSKQEPPSKK